MSKTTDKYRAMGVFNPFILVSRARDAGVSPAVYLSWQPQVHQGLHYEPAGFSVIRPGFKTDSSRFNGHKFFMKFGDRDAEAEAKAWASERYGVPEWVKIPGFSRDWFPLEVAEFAKALLKVSA